MKYFFALMITGPHFAHAQSCLPNLFVQFPESWPNSDSARFLRVDPQGKYLMISDKSAYVVSDFQNAASMKMVETRLHRETVFPNGKSWDIVISADHDNAMEYLRFDDLLKKPAGAKAFYSDTQLNKQYHYAAVLENSDSEEKIRVITYPPARFRDLTFKKATDGSRSLASAGEIKKMCSNQPRMLKPTLSADGSEVAGTFENPANQQMTTKILKMDAAGACTEVEDLGINAAKLTFDLPRDSKQGLVAYVGSSIDSSGQVGSQIFVYDRDSKTTYPVKAEGDFGVDLGGFTQDGKLVYLTKRSAGNNEQMGIGIAKVTEILTPRECPQKQATPQSQR